MASLSEIQEETLISQIPSTQPMKRIPTQAGGIIQNPNKLNYKLYWRLCRGDYALCESMLDKWRAQSCKNYEFGHFLQALLHRKKGNISESLKSIKLCHMIDPTNQVYLKELVRTFCILGKHKTALSLLKNVPEASLDWELLEQLGDIHLYLKDLTSAKECYLQALQKGSNKNIILKLGKLYLKEGNTSETKDLFSKYAESLDSQILEELGFIYLTINNRPEALHYLGQAIVQNPQNTDILLSLGTMSQDFGDTDGAFQRYKEFYALNQNSAEMWSNLGNGYLEREIYVSALSCFKRALYLNPLDWGLYFNLGLVYLNLKVYSVSFHYFMSSIKYNPQNSESYMLLGVCLNKLSDPANAYNAYQKACTMDPENHMTYLNMAIFLAEHAKDEANAKLAKEKFVKHDELYSISATGRDPQVEAQRNILRSLLNI